MQSVFTLVTQRCVTRNVEICDSKMFDISMCMWLFNYQGTCDTDLWLNVTLSDSEELTIIIKRLWETILEKTRTWHLVRRIRSNYGDVVLLAWNAEMKYKHNTLKYHEIAFVKFDSSSCQSRLKLCTVPGIYCSFRYRTHGDLSM